MACVHGTVGRCLLCEREAGNQYRIPVSQPCVNGKEREYVLKCLENNQLTHGPMVAMFEQRFSQYLKVRDTVMCSSGTTALHLALLAAGIGPGDEVLVPDMTFIASVNAVTYTGATPVLVDIDRTSWGISPARVEEAVTPRTKAIIVVHLYGQPAKMQELWPIIHKYNLTVIEDAAEGLGADIEGTALGTFGHIGTFSFYGNKVMTTGEGGACVTNVPQFADRMRSLRGQGQHPTRRYFHPEVGYNYRMTDLQAAVGLAQLEELPSRLNDRHTIFDYYRMLLESLPDTQLVSGNAAPWLFTLRLPSWIDRSRLMLELEHKGIDTRPTFVPMHRMPMYLQDETKFPESNRVGDFGISLPTFPELAVRDVDFIANEVRDLVLKQKEER